MAVLLPLEEPFVAGMAIGCPRAFSVRLMSSLSISSRVERVSSSTSADVRLVVGIGARTVLGICLVLFTGDKRNCRGYLRHTFDGNLARVENQVLDVEDMAVVGDNDGHDGHARLYGQVESALFEGQQHRLLCVASCALGEHVDALALSLDLVGRAVHGRASALAVLAIDEDGAAEAHEPSQKGHALQLSLCRDTAVFGENGAQHEDVQLGLVVSNEDCGAGRAEDVVRVFDDELDTGAVAHGKVKGAGACPLRNLALADEGEHNGGDDTVEGADEERDIGGEDTGHEAGLGDDEGRHIEGDRQGGVAEEEFDEVVEEEDHLFGGGSSLRLSAVSDRVYIREESRRVADGGGGGEEWTSVPRFRYSSMLLFQKTKRKKKKRFSCFLLLIH